MIDGSEEEQAEIFDFLSDYLDDLDSGVRRPLSDYLARHPGHEQAIAREWLRRTEERGRGAEDGGDASADTRRIGAYALVRELGRGGQGSVWLAEDTRIARRVALKLLDAGAISSERRARLRREAETVARLDHPGICHVYEALVDGEVPYIAMRFVEGESMARSIARRADGPESGFAIDPIPWIPHERADLERVLRI
jgi:serine/threonine protein kinase